MRTSEDPNNGHRSDDKHVPPLQKECVPKPQLRLERNRIRKQRDIPLGRIRHRRNRILFLQKK